jgi:hypothetical protein
VPISSLKIRSCMKCSFHKGTQFLQGKNTLLDAPASNRYDFLSRDTFVSSTSYNALLERRDPTSALQTLRDRRYSFPNQLKYHMESMCLMLLLLTHMVFFQDIHVFLQLSWRGVIGVNIAYVHRENPVTAIFRLNMNSNLTQAAASNIDRCFPLER